MAFAGDVVFEGSNPPLVIPETIRYIHLFAYICNGDIPPIAQYQAKDQAFVTPSLTQED